MRELISLHPHFLSPTPICAHTEPTPHVVQFSGRHSLEGVGVGVIVGVGRNKQQIGLLVPWHVFGSTPYLIQGCTHVPAKHLNSASSPDWVSQGKGMGVGMGLDLQHT